MPRCPNGTRKFCRKKNCSQKYVPRETSTPYYAKFYNVSNIFPSASKKILQEYVKTPTISPGDILLVGSKFYLVTLEKKVVGGMNTATELPMKYRSKIPDRIYYNHLFLEIFNLYKNSDRKQYNYVLAHRFFDMSEGKETETLQKTQERYDKAGMLEPAFFFFNQTRGAF